MTAAEVMSRKLVEVAASSTVAEAATLMARERVGSTLVLEGGRVAGIFTERDIVRALSLDPDAPREELVHWMTRDPVVIAPEVDVEEAVARMLAGHFRHLPVVEDGAVVGMLSMRDLVRAGVLGATG